MSAAKKRKRVAGDAERARVSAMFKNAIRKAFSCEPFSSGRKMLRTMNKRNVARLPFVNEFSSFPLQLTQRGVCGAAIVPLTTSNMASAFLESKDDKVFYKWYRDAIPHLSKRSSECEIADKRLADRMDATLNALVDARAASLRAFCADELDTLKEALDWCVQRMRKWDAADVDVEKFIATLDD